MTSPPPARSAPDGAPRPGESAPPSGDLASRPGEAPPRQVSRCPHCGAPVEGPEDLYCCAGCEMAAAIISRAGLERYYAEREAYAPRPEPLAGGWDALPVEQGPDGLCEIRLAIDGLRCASCVWVAENVLQRTTGVAEAQVSYATGRATLRWDPDKVRLGELAGRIAGLGYRPRLLGEESRPDRALLLRLGVAAFAAANVMSYAAALYAGWFGGMEAHFAALFRWMSLILATPVALWCASPFYAGAWAGLKARVLHLDLPIAIAVGVLYVHGLVGTFRGFDGYLDSMTMLVALLLAGRVLESRGRRRAAEAAVTLAATIPATARRMAGGSVESVPSADLVAGDRVVAGAGEELPADGVVADGTGSLRLALLTGESAPVQVGVGDRVWAGTVVVDGSLVVEVTEAAEGTVISRMAEELRAAADRGTRPSSTDRIAPWFTAGTLAVAAATFFTWWLAAGLGAALTTSVAVLVVACPCALALSRPLAAASGLGAAARRGLLFRSADALLELADVDLVGLDKTGTVTAGALDVVAAGDEDLRIAAGLERFSIHPVATAIVHEAATRRIPLPPASDVHEDAGVGISGTVDGVRWRIRSGGAGVVVLEGEDGYRGLVRLGDAVRPDSAAAVARIRALGVEVALLTGDHPEAAERIAALAGIHDVQARVTPEAKAEWVRERQREGRRVLFAGDGLNDGPALAAADVGVAMGSGAASSILTADGVLAAGSLLPLATGIQASRACRHAILWNQIRSIVYNIVAVGAAAAGWVNPLVAAVLMPFSSVLVVWGASRVEAEVRRSEAA
ncbi:MAG TPA: heavy metal translocating P-type ATPase metal-binding domain-containing protein [Longimicrobiales bacterium]|nr:heavy metal translocating P-type ATPase metal-binding domain-containing protein [Longimicrobiales bacterium]